MSEPENFEPKIIAYVCNWCTYLGADLAGTNRLEYPANVRIVRLPCTGRIDFNLIIKAFEMGADAVLVSGCHPGDCHYTAGNYHARRRWMLFRQLLEAVGIETERVHFTWISAAEGKKWQQVVAELTEKTRKLGPYAGLPRSLRGQRHDRQHFTTPAGNCFRDGKVDVVIGYGQDPGEPADGPVFPVFITAAGRCRPTGLERSLPGEPDGLSQAAGDPRPGPPGDRVKGCDQRALVVLEKESQLDRSQIDVIGMACDGMGRPKC